MTSVMNCAKPKNRPMMMASASTTPIRILLPFDDLRGRFGWRVIRGPDGPLGGMFAEDRAVLSPSVSTLRMMGSSLPDLLARCPWERFGPLSGSNMGPNISKKDILIAYRQARNGFMPLA